MSCNWLIDYGCCSENGLLSVWDTSRNARRREIILEMLRSEPVIYEPVSIFQVGFTSWSLYHFTAFQI